MQIYVYAKANNNDIPSEARDLTIDCDTCYNAKVRSFTSFGRFGMTTANKGAF